MAIVTGGNKGIGFATVKTLATIFDGDIYLTARDVLKGMDAVNRLRKNSARVFFHQLDISDPQSNETIADFFKTNYGGIDVLINNAAVAFKEDSQEKFADKAKVVVGTNYFGVKMTCETLFPLLKKGARVVNVSSAAGSLFNIKDESLRKEFAREDLTFDELDDLINRFLASAANGTHVDNGWPNRYLLCLLSAVARSISCRLHVDLATADFLKPMRP